jgi:hypothetical protein
VLLPRSSSVCCCSFTLPEALRSSSVRHAKRLVLAAACARRARTPRPRPSPIPATAADAASPAASADRSGGPPATPAGTRDPVPSRQAARGLSPRAGSTPPQLAAKCRDHRIRRHAGTRLGAGNPQVASPRRFSLGCGKPGTFRFGIGCSGCYVPSPGQAGRSRDTRSKQEDPIRFRTLIDAGKPELYGRQQPFWPLLGSGGALARRVISCPRPRRIAWRKIGSRLSALASTRRGDRPPS